MNYSTFLSVMSSDHSIATGIYARNSINGNATSKNSKFNLMLYSFYTTVLKDVNGDVVNSVLSKDDLMFIIRDINSLFGSSLTYDFQ